MRKQFCWFFEITAVATIWLLVLVTRQDDFALLILLPTNPIMARLYIHIFSTDLKLWRQIYRVHHL